MSTTDHLIDLLESEGLTVHDLRGELPEHPSKRYRRRTMSEVKGLCVHHNAGAAKGRVTAFRDASYHVERRNWPGLAYFAQVGPAGEVYICNDIEACGYAQGTRQRIGDENREFVAIAVQGAFASKYHPDLDEPALVQIATVLRMWDVISSMIGLTSEALFGHFDLGKASCPGWTLEGVIRAVRGEHE